MHARDQRRFAVRVWLLGALFTLGLVAVLLRSAHLQIARHEHLSKLSREEYLRKVRVPARRGLITDRKGVALARSTHAPSLYANPQAIQDPRRAARQLSRLLAVDLDTIYQRLGSDKHFVWLRRRVSEDMAAAALQLGIDGVSVIHEPIRVYPNGEVAAHLLGVVGIDGEGLEGVERQLDDALIGEPQVVTAVRDARGRSVLGAGLDPRHAAAGADVRLTVDLAIQHAAQQALDAAVRTTRADSGVAVVLGVRDADILAVAVSPSFDPNDRAKPRLSRRRNRAITDMFEPGSTLKPIVIAAALEAGAVHISDPIYGENGTLRIGGRTIRDTKPLGWMGLDTLIAKSSNIGAAKVGQALGRERLHGALSDFGFGSRTGVPFPGESPGLLWAPRTWSEVGVATISFGYGVAVTAVQMAVAYRVLAAGGEYRSPQLIAGIERPDGTHKAVAEPTVRRVLSPRVAARVTRMMRKVVSADGTGLRAAVEGYAVAGKTGTAQKHDPVTRGYMTDRFIASFAGFLPADAPRAVIFVALDDPQDGHTGGRVAAPVFAQIARATMVQLGVVPTQPIGDHESPLPSPLAGSGTSGNGHSGPGERPIVALDMPVGGPGRMPSFVGMTSRQVVERFVELGLGLELEMVGSGTVTKQSPRAGTPRSAATRVRLVLAER